IQNYLNERDKAAIDLDTLESVKDSHITTDLIEYRCSFRFLTFVLRKPLLTFQQPTCNAGDEHGITAEASSP
ncbi:MAG: hypothetical protein ACLFQB_14315, partial [Chitinispirillaceae bacterium]